MLISVNPSVSGLGGFQTFKARKAASAEGLLEGGASSPPPFLDERPRSAGEARQQSAVATWRAHCRPGVAGGEFWCVGGGRKKINFPLGGGDKKTLSHLKRSVFFQEWSLNMIQTKALPTLRSMESILSKFNSFGMARSLPLRPGTARNDDGLRSGSWIPNFGL